ncbi:MAG: alpha/beta hydrolase, partial [Aquihabitans sp.]
MTLDTVHIKHVGVDLALHQLREGTGRPLLLLHHLGGATPTEVPRHLAAWTGPVWGLDFTGHGASSIPAGGGYTAETLMADVDHALGHLGECTLYGQGLGAY